MFRSNSPLRVGGSLLLLVLSGVPAGLAQTMPIRDYVWVKAFMRAAFPELAGHGYSMEVSFDDHFDSEALPPRVRVTVRGPAPARPGGGVWPVLISGTFASPPDSLGDSARFDTPEGDDTRRLHSVAEQAALHPEWTDEDIVKALHGVGAEYPLDRREAFLRHLDVTRFAPFLGAVRNVQVDFVWRRPEAPEIVPIIGWRVRLEIAGPYGSVSRYILILRTDARQVAECVDGAVTHLARDPFVTTSRLLRRLDTGVFPTEEHKQSWSW